MTNNDLKRVQEIDYELLCAVDEICKKHNIQYYLFYGTLLGAVRHKGQIPWDDDVDIAMTRDNYLRFYEIAPSELDDSRFFVKLMGSGSTKYVSEVKVGRKGTTYCMPGTEDTNVMHNVFIDIFCLDYAKKHSIKKHLFYRKIWGILKLFKLNWSEKELLMICIKKSGSRIWPLYDILLVIMHIVRFVFGERFFERIGYKMFVDDSNKSNCFIPVSSLSGHLYEIKWFDRVENLEFNGRLFPVPVAYKEVLMTDYQNYMQLPPADKRYIKHFNSWVFKEDLL